MQKNLETDNSMYIVDTKILENKIISMTKIQPIVWITADSASSDAYKDLVSKIVIKR